MFTLLRKFRKWFQSRSIHGGTQPSHCEATDGNGEANPKGETYVDRLNTEIRTRSLPLAESVLASDDPKLFFEEDEELAQLLWKDMFMPLCELIDLPSKAGNQENFPGSEHCRCGKIPSSDFVDKENFQ